MMVHDVKVITVLAIVSLHRHLSLHAFQSAFPLGVRSSSSANHPAGGKNKAPFFAARKNEYGSDSSDVEDGLVRSSDGSSNHRNDSDGSTTTRSKTKKPKKLEGGKARLARATASLIAKRKEEEESSKQQQLSFSSAAYKNKKRRMPYSYAENVVDRGRGEVGDNSNQDDDNDKSSFQLMDLTKKIDQKISRNNWARSSRRSSTMVKNNNDKTQSSPGAEFHVQHETDSMQSLLGYNQHEGDWSDKNSTTYHVAVVFGKPLIRDQVTIEYATRLRTMVKMLKDEPSFQPSLICFTGGISGENTISDAAAGYVYFRHLCAMQGISIDDSQTKFWVDDNNAKDDGSSNERDAVERIAQELWRNNIKQWLKESPLTERLNQHCEF